MACLYEPCHVAVALLNREDQVDCNGSGLPRRTAALGAGATTAESVNVRFADLPAGSYKLAVGLFLQRKTKPAVYRLGIQGRTTDGWYVLHDKLRAEWIYPSSIH